MDAREGREWGGWIDDMAAGQRFGTALASGAFGPPAGPPPEWPVALLPSWPWGAEVMPPPPESHPEIRADPIRAAESRLAIDARDIRAPRREGSRPARKPAREDGRARGKHLSGHRSVRESPNQAGEATQINPPISLDARKKPGIFILAINPPGEIP